MGSPGLIYRQRLAETTSALEHQRKWHHALGYAKIGMFLAAAIVAVALLHTPRLMGWLGIPLAIFIALLIVHDRILRRLEKSTRTADFYARGLARLEDQ